MVDKYSRIYRLCRLSRVKIVHYIFKLVLVVLLFTSTSVEAKLYKWIDEKGETHFSQTPPRDINQDFESKSMDSMPNVNPECCSDVRKVVLEMSQLCYNLTINFITIL